MNDPNRSLYTVSEEEKYCFDLRGYLIVSNVLCPDEIEACNAALDHFSDKIQTLEAGSLSGGSSALTGSFGRRQLTGMLGWPTPYRKPFRQLLVHPNITLVMILDGATYHQD